jgi:hypothetical protein
MEERKKYFMDCHVAIVHTEHLIEDTLTRIFLMVASVVNLCWQLIE